MTSSTTKSPINNQPLSEQYYEASIEWADLDAAASLLESTKSAVLSQKVLAMGDMAINRAEAQVKADPSWIGHLEKIIEARRLANHAFAKREYIRMLAMEQHSAQATERTAARI